MEIWKERPGLEATLRTINHSHWRTLEEINFIIKDIF